MTANNVKLPLAFLFFLGVFTFGCSRTDTSNQTSVNTNASAKPVANSTGSTSQVPANPDLNAQAPVGSNVPAPQPTVANRAENAPTASIRARDVNATAGREFTLEIELESKADISVMVFSLDFDPNVFTYVSSKISPGTPKSAVLTVNAEQTAAGKFGAMLDSSEAFAGSKKPIMTVVFRVAPGTAAVDHQISFSSKPARQSVSSIKTELVNTIFESATVRVGAPR